MPTPPSILPPDHEYQRLPELGKCDCCDTKNVILFIYTTLQKSEYHLCEVCIDSSIRATLHSLTLITPDITMRFVAQCTNKILKEIRRAYDTIQLTHSPDKDVVIEPFRSFSTCKDPARLIDPEGKVIDDNTKPIKKEEVMNDDEFFECITGNPEIIEHL